MRNLFTLADKHVAACGEIPQTPEKGEKLLVERNYLSEVCEIPDRQA